MITVRGANWFRAATQGPMKMLKSRGAHQASASAGGRCFPEGVGYQQQPGPKRKACREERPARRGNQSSRESNRPVIVVHYWAQKTVPGEGKGKEQQLVGERTGNDNGGRVEPAHIRQTQVRHPDQLSETN